MSNDPFPRERASATLRRLPAYLRLAWRLAKDPLLGRARRAAVVAAAGYLASPIDLVPGVIPVVGQLDDVAVALAALRFALAGLDAERRREHLAAVGLADGDLAEDLRTVGATSAWIVRAGARTTARAATVGARTTARAATVGGRAVARGATVAATTALPAAASAAKRAIPAAKGSAAKAVPAARAGAGRAIPTVGSVAGRAAPLVRDAAAGAGAAARGAASLAEGATRSATTGIGAMRDRLASVRPPIGRRRREPPPGDATDDGVTVSRRDVPALGPGAAPDAVANEGAAVDPATHDQLRDVDPAANHGRRADPAANDKPGADDPGAEPPGG